MRLKLPAAVLRFGRKATPSETPAAQPPPQPETAAAPTAQPSRLDRLNRWLTLGANLGVLLGLVMLVVEVRQNASLTRTAMEHQKNDLLAQIELSLAKREMAEVWAKSIRTPEDLTDAEIRMVESHLVAQMLQWQQLFDMESAGLVSHQRVRLHITNTAPFYFGSRFAKHWWAGEAPGWSGTPMMDVAGPIIDEVDEDFLVKRLDSLKLPPPEPALPETEATP
ncbi:MAG TPA: hypothetical protein PK417_05790 [Hyphomonas sp.]|nr:hypothetical protein [Hyphomonas sp.]HRX73835.1 hypothetical protein [Hyphomonas sp.]